MSPSCKACSDRWQFQEIHYQLKWNGLPTQFMRRETTMIYTIIVMSHFRGESDLLAARCRYLFEDISC